MTDFLKDKRIIVIHQRDWAINHGFEITKKLNQFGSKLATINFKKSTEHFINNQKEVKFEFSLNESDVSKKTKEIIKKNNYSLKEFEKDFELNNIWKYAHTLRQYSLSYNKKYPFSYEQNISDETIVEYILAFACSLRKLFNEFKPELIIGYNFGDIKHYLIQQLSNKYKIPFFFSSDTKVQNISAFYYDINSSKSFFLDKVKKFNISINNSSNLQNAKNYLSENRQKLKIAFHMRDIKLTKKWYNLSDVKKLISMIFYHFKKNDRLKKKQITASDNTNLFYLIRDYISERKNIIDTQNFKYDKIENINNFIFFPLQHYPESQLGLLNPVHDHVLSTIRTLARFLPNGITLVTKDHPWTFGKRSKTFLNKIQNTLNVKIIHPSTPMDKIYQKMKYLISFGGTVVFESSIFFKPAILIGDLEMMSELPNVYKLKHLEEISSIITTIEESFDNRVKDNYDEKLLNYISAAYDIGFKNDIYQSNLRNNQKNLDYMWDFYFKEIKKVFELKNKFKY